MGGSLSAFYKRCRENSNSSEINENCEGIPSNEGFIIVDKPIIRKVDRYGMRGIDF